MIVGRTSPRGGSVTILAPTAHAAAAAIAIGVARWPEQVRAITGSGLSEPPS